MASTKVTRYAMAAALVLIALPLFAQAPATPPVSPGGGAPVGSQPEPKLAFDREVFGYPAEGRRDPFKPLLGGPNSGGPLFNDIVLRGIIYSPEPRRSVALVQVGGRRTFRLRQGDVIGNARVLEIQSLRVRFAVENFGTVRTETLELSKTQFLPSREAADTAAQRAVPVVPDRNERDMISAPKPNPAVIKKNDGGTPTQPEARR